MAFVVLRNVRNEEHCIHLFLKDKLKHIRLCLGLPQDQLAERLGLVGVSRRSRVSEWESGRCEPDRFVLLKYSEIGDVDIGKLIDDEMSLDL